MLFSHKPAVIMFVARDSVALYPGASPKDHAVKNAASYPEGCVQYLEVRDSKKFSEFLAAFCQNAALRGKRVLVMLGKEVVLQKAVVLDQTSKVSEITADFAQKVPFTPEERQTISLQQKDRLFLFGANKVMYRHFVTALEHTGAKVQGVVPGIAYGISEVSKLTQAKLQQTRDAAALTKASDFLAHGQ